MGTKQHFLRRLVSLALYGTLLSTASCTLINAYEDPALVGKWVGRTPVGDQRDSLRAKLDGSGDGTLFYLLAADPNYYQAVYRITWEQTDEEEFELQLSCVNSSRLGQNCGEDNAVMECKAKSEGDRLACEVVRFNPAWHTRGFDFERKD